MLLIQPSVRAVQADEPGPTQFVVGGVAGATVRAAPNGTSDALATVTPGSIVSQAGADVVDNGVVWRQVRTPDGIVGYVPAGFLVALDSGSTVASAPANGPPAGPAATAPATSTSSVASAAPTSTSAPSAGQPSSQSVQSGAGQPSSAVAAPPSTIASHGTPASSDPPGMTVATAGASSASGSSQPRTTSAQQAGQTPAGSPTTTPSGPSGPSGPPKGVRTTIEHRRGQDVELTHLDMETAPDGRPMVAGRILVGFKPGAAQATRQAAHQAAGALSTSSLSTASVGLQDVTVADVTAGATAQALAAYRSRPDVAWAEPDYVKRATLTPNDPCFSSATGACPVPQYGPQKISAPAAWDVTEGSAATRVAILDCGIYTESSTFTAPDGLKGHPDLRGKVVAEANFTASTHGADDFCDHGTMMAGIAGARTNTSPAVGVAGVGFNVSLLNGKVLDDFGDGSDSGVASGITWATDNGAKVISMSLGGPGPCSNTLQAAVDYAWARNIVIVSAAGNGGDDGIGDPAPESPGNCNHVIPVGATDQNDQRASFSNYGLAVPLAAPGVSVLSTNFVGGYRTVSGTSPATPHVAGVAGLLWSTSYGTSNQAIVSRLLATADPIVGTGSVWANGRLNAASAVGTVSVSCSPRPPVTITTAPATAGRLVTIAVSNPGNTIQSVELLNFNAATTNAQAVTFSAGSTSTVSTAGTLTVTPTTKAAQQSFVLKRLAAGQPTTLRFVVHDACGAWTSFVGGGVSAGF